MKHEIREFSPQVVSINMICVQVPIPLIRVNLSWRQLYIIHKCNFFLDEF